MGGYPKGLLRTPDGRTLVEQHVELAHSLGMRPILVGARAEYQSLLPGVHSVQDETQLQGPIAGLRALLAETHGQNVFAVACDMPRLDQALFAQLRAQPLALVTASRVLGSDKWNPFPARYQGALDVLEAAIAEGVRSFQGFFRYADAQACELTHAALVDADTPEAASWLHLRRAPYWSLNGSRGTNETGQSSAGASLTTAL